MRRVRSPPRDHAVVEQGISSASRGDLVGRPRQLSPTRPLQHESRSAGACADRPAWRRNWSAENLREARHAADRGGQGARDLGH